MTIKYSETKLNKDDPGVVATLKDLVETSTSELLKIKDGAISANDIVKLFDNGEIQKSSINNTSVLAFEGASTEAISATN